jgi:hypothetical protein
MPAGFFISRQQMSDTHKRRRELKRAVKPRASRLADEHTISKADG